MKLTGTRDKCKTFYFLEVQEILKEYQDNIKMATFGNFIPEKSFILWLHKITHLKIYRANILSDFDFRDLTKFKMLKHLEFDWEEANSDGKSHQNFFKRINIYVQFSALQISSDWIVDNQLTKLLVYTNSNQSFTEFFKVFAQTQTAIRELKIQGIIFDSIDSYIKSAKSLNTLGLELTALNDRRDLLKVIRCHKGENYMKWSKLTFQKLREPYEVLANDIIANHPEILEITLEDPRCFFQEGTLRYIRKAHYRFTDDGSDRSVKDMSKIYALELHYRDDVFDHLHDASKIQELEDFIKRCSGLETVKLSLVPSKLTTRHLRKILTALKHLNCVRLIMDIDQKQKFGSKLLDIVKTEGQNFELILRSKTHESDLFNYVKEGLCVWQK